MYTTYVNKLYPGWMLAVSDKAELSVEMTENGWLLALRMSGVDLECMTQDLGSHTVGEEKFCLFKTRQNQAINLPSLGGLLAASLMLADYQRQNATDCAQWLQEKCFQRNQAHAPR